MQLNDLTPTQTLVYNMYKDEKGEPILLTPGQDFIFKNIGQKLSPRIHCMCHTRYGKSMTVGMAVLTRAATYPEKWAIIAGQKEKAKIVMDHVISHIFDNDFTKDRFVPDKGESIEDVRRYRSKNRLTFATDQMENGKTLLSEVFIGSAKDALGFGAPNVVEDESALIPDDEHSLVMRMLGDNPVNNFLIKIGNPFNRNHFLKSFKDPKYLNVVVDCYRSLKEGRITQQVIEENKDYAFFKVLYECVFPRENEIDELGYQLLVLLDDINVAQARIVEPAGKPMLGVDVAKGGRNFNCWVLRGSNYARKLLKNNEEDSVKIADQTVALMREYGVDPREVYIDDTGVGHGVVSILKNKSLRVNAVNFGEKAKDDKHYINLRAESYAGEQGVATWIKQGAKLFEDADWKELNKVRYRKKMDGRTQIEPKEDMRKRGIESPDVADALALTFAKVKKYNYTNIINPAAVLGATGNQWSGLQKFPDMPG